MAVLDDLQKAIENGHPQETETLAEQALNAGISPTDMVEQAMTQAMRNIGERYKHNEIDIPQILTAARSVRRCFEILEEQNKDFKCKKLGTIILGTIEGDLHDVGKNLVAIMFRSAGFKVIDLGVDISERQFLKAVKENPDVSIVCISSLLSTTIPEMKQVVKALRKSDPHYHFRIMVGGGAVNRELATGMGADAYTDNCVDAAEVAKTFIV